MIDFILLCVCGCINYNYQRIHNVDVEMLRRAKVGDLKKIIKQKVDRKPKNNHREGISW